MTAWVTVVSSRSCMTGSPWTKLFASARFFRNRVPQRADAGDFHFYTIAGLHPYRRLAVGADAAGGSGDDDVARLQHGEGRTIGDQRRNAEHQIVQCGRLHDLAIEPADQLG